ncbi:MAG: hypothetical protein JRJ00_04855 [Deltaproteobacteria bacterium]|nr:hypothetical protein [Deltaproteobacteria bacterium]
MFNKKFAIINLLLLALIIYFPTQTVTFAATWSALSPIPSDSNLLLEDFQYDYNPAASTVTMTYSYKNITGFTIHNPRVVNLFTWSNDICSVPWETMSYDGAGEFSNSGQSATAVVPDELFDWHGLISTPTPPLDSSGLFPSLPIQTTQGGVSYPSWNLCTITAGEWANDEVATFSTSWSVLTPYWVQSLNWIATCEGVDCPAFPAFDDDGDGVTVCNDNCPDHSNAGQEDSYPPGGNGIGDACECEADFDCDFDVDAEDVTAFLKDFGRGQYNNPCSSGNRCNGDFLCDGDVDATDVTKFLEDFGRNMYNNACPACVEGDYCVY